MTNAIIARPAASRLAQNGPDAPHSAIHGAETKGKMAPPKKRNAENAEDEICRGKSVAFRAASVNKVLATPWTPPNTIMPTIVTTRFSVLTARSRKPRHIDTRVKTIAGTRPRSLKRGAGTV